MTGPQEDLLFRTSAPRPITLTCAADLLHCGAVPNQCGRVGSHRVALELRARVSRLQFQFQVKCHKPILVQNMARGSSRACSTWGGAAGPRNPRSKS